VHVAVIAGEGTTAVSYALTLYVTLVALRLVASVVGGTSTRIGGGAALPVEMSSTVTASRMDPTIEKRRKATAPWSRGT
jgi:hypothetical protein